MKIFYADLHIHSKFSRATSKKLSVRHLAAWAGVKGIQVVATGDATHPQWLAEIKEELIQEENGLLSLKNRKGLEEEIPWLKPGAWQGKTQFILCSEISCIYKKNGQVRKNHNLVFFPSLEKQEAFNKKLSQVGNLHSDGRPILGLDAHDLLEMVLETGPNCFLIPAHIWTPWFSLFGSKSGFDTIEECFADLTPEIFALETGLSSDPEMNWLWSALDNLRLVSNSDAHSGEKLGREANIFAGEPSYDSIFWALKGKGLGQDFLGTIEFFPEEGKYHLDGHRKCGVVLDPRESKKLENICPNCGKPLTIGVLNRVMNLADRNIPKQPSGQPGFYSLIPLPEIISELIGVGPKSKKVSQQYAKLISQLGPELKILNQLPEEEMRRFHPLLGEAISRMRRKEVFKQPGFDGQYGKISVFSPEELQGLRSGSTLVSGSWQETQSQSKTRTTACKQEKKEINTQSSSKTAKGHKEDKGAFPDFSSFPRPHKQTPGEKEQLVFNPGQQTAIAAGPNPVLVIAGPGTGKTRTLIGRVTQLILNNINPRRILVVTFTRSAARELEERLLTTLGPTQALPRADTLHALAYENWLTTHGQSPVLTTEDEARRLFAQANPKLKGRTLDRLWKELSLCREEKNIPDHLQVAADNYFQIKDQCNLCDYTDLLESWFEQLSSQQALSPYTQILVDEVQDLSFLQIELLAKLLPDQGEGFFAIGDPRQSIYSFRGALSHVESHFKKKWPTLEVISLNQNYRSAQEILNFVHPLFPEQDKLTGHSNLQGEIYTYQCQSDYQEQTWIGEGVRKLLGGTNHLAADQGKTGGLAPGDIAVLVRFKALIPGLERTLSRMGLPCIVPEKAPFWQDQRIQLILNSVACFYGLPLDQELATLEAAGTDLLQCTEKTILQGPIGFAAYFQDIPPFDHLFWKSTAFLELKKAFKKQGSWTNLLNWIHLETDLSQIRSKAQKIRIMTIHAAKGLEFEAVFMPALEDGILPFAGRHFLSGRIQEGERQDPEEERRLLYVGLTRAKRFLFLSWAKKRTIFGRTLQLAPSSFLQDLPLETAHKFKAVVHKKKQAKQLKLI